MANQEQQAQQQRPAQNQNVSILRYVLNILIAFYNYIYSFFAGTPDETEEEPQEIPKRVPPKEIDERLKALGVGMPTFFDGPFREAVKTAAGASQLLLIYFHKKDDSPFVKEVVGNPVFTSFVSANFMFYPIESNSKEGEKFARIFKLKVIPSLVLVQPDQAMKLHVQKIMTVNHSIDYIMTTLLTTFETFERIAELGQDGGMSQHQAEMHQQDRAFLEAMERDRQLEEEKKKEEQEKIKAAEEAAKAAEEKKKRMDILQEERASLRSKLASINENDEPTALVKFRFPNGSTLSHKFPLTSKIELMYQFIHILDADTAVWAPHPNSSMEQYELSTVFPRQTLQPSVTIQDAKLANQTISVVEHILEDDVDAEEMEV